MILSRDLVRHSLHRHGGDCPRGDQDGHRRHLHFYHEQHWRQLASPGRACQGHLWIQNGPLHLLPWIGWC